MGVKILIYGYGNPGRQDDGLGNALVEQMEAWARNEGIDNIAFDSNYQLNIEDAHNISAYDLVIFADASTEEISEYDFTVVDGSSKVAFTSHAASPGYVTKLCKELYGKTPAVYLLHIKGYEWAFREGLTKSAQRNLGSAIDFMVATLQKPAFLIESFKHENISTN